MSGTGPAGPRFWTVARRPRWIAALLLALGVAAAFAALGQWQLERSVDAAVVNEVDTETAVPLDAIAVPGSPVTGDQLGRRVTVSGRFDPRGFVVLEGRQHEGEPGAWLVGRLLVEDASASSDVSLAVALGWAPDADAALAAIPEEGPVAMTGRYLPSEAPDVDDAEAGVRRALSIGELVNLWPDYDGAVYAGYLVAGDAPAGLATIDAPPPEPEPVINWLNLFYAVEWVIFAGFAVYLWWRLVRDAQEREAGEHAGPAGEDAAVGSRGPAPRSP